MNFLHCEISDGPRQGFKTVGIESVEGYNEYLSIEERFLAKRCDEMRLPVSVIGQDRKQGIVLIQLPVEADSGANRVWVRKESVQDGVPDEVMA